MSLMLSNLERRFNALGLHVTAGLMPDGDRCLVARDKATSRPFMIKISRSLDDAANYLYSDCVEKKQAQRDWSGR